MQFFQDLLRELKKGGDSPIYKPTGDSDSDIQPLDELFAAQARYHYPDEYIRMLEFIGRMANLAPYNAMILYSQAPDATFVATAFDWWTRFARRPKRNAKPHVIMRYFGPVEFVYDVSDTEGEEIDEGSLDPLDERGRFEQDVFDSTVESAKLLRVAVRTLVLPKGISSRFHSLDKHTRASYSRQNIDATSRYLILLNPDDSSGERYGTLAHVLAQLLCGHLGASALDEWDDRSDVPEEMRKIEAASAAYLVAKRKGLDEVAERYLAAYRRGRHGDLIPNVSLHQIIHATSDLERMGRGSFKLDKKQGFDASQISLF